MKMNVFGRFVTIIERVQHSSTSHMQCAVQLKRLYHEIDEDDFFGALKKYMIHFLRVDLRSTNRSCERAIEFISIFVANTMGPENLDTEEENPDDSIMETVFQTKVFDFLLYVQNLDNKTLRFRACQILTKLFGLMIENNLSIEMCDKLQSALIERFADSCLAVRLQAANCLYRLQDPKDPNNPVLQVYLDHAHYDPSAKVRSICIEKIAMRMDILKALVNSTRDIDANVRFAAFKRLSKAFPKHLEIVDRQAVILGVLTDNCERNTSFVKSILIPKWFEKYDNKYMEFFAAFRLHSFRVDIKNTYRIIKFITKSLCDVRPIHAIITSLDLNKDRCIPLKNLNWDSVLFWRSLIDLIYEKSKSDDSYEQILHEQLVPELMIFIKYIREYIETCGMRISEAPNNYNPSRNPYSEQTPIDQHQFIIQQLFCITRVFIDDFSDLVLRRTFNTLVSDSLKGWYFDTDTIQTMVSGLELSIPIVNGRIKFICELIAEICEPTTPAVSDLDSFMTPAPPNHVNEEDKSIELPIIENALHIMNGQDISFELAQIKLNYHRLSNMIEVAISKEDYLGANEYKIKKDKVQDKIQELQVLMIPPATCEPYPEKDKDSIIALLSEELSEAAIPQLSTWTICQVLDIAGGLLVQGRVDQFSAELGSLHKNMIVGYLIHEEIAVKVRALRSLAQCCVLNKELARSFIWMFCSPIQEYEPALTPSPEVESLSMCMWTICDLLRLFGTILISDASTSNIADKTEDLHKSALANSSLISVIHGLVRMMENETGELQYDTVVVLCMLVQNGIIRSSNVLSRLLLIWTLPSSAYDDEYGEWCKQYVGFLIQNFKMLTSAPEMVQNSFLPTVKTLVNAPKTSPHSEVNVEGIVKFILELALSLDSNGTIHETWASWICTHLRNKPTSKYNVEFSKILLQLKLNSEESTYDLKGICNSLKSDLKDKFVLKNIYKFSTKISNFISKTGSEEFEENENKDEEEYDSSDVEVVYENNNK